MRIPSRTHFGALTSFADLVTKNGTSGRGLLCCTVLNAVDLRKLMRSSEGTKTTSRKFRNSRGPSLSPSEVELGALDLNSHLIFGYQPLFQLPFPDTSTMWRSGRGPSTWQSGHGHSNSVIGVHNHRMAFSKQWVLQSDAAPWLLVPSLGSMIPWPTPTLAPANPWLPRD